jgi:stage IV sporulation protein FB
MLLQEPAESPYDLRFQLFGFPIRIAWSFWIGSLIFGFYLVQGLDQYLAELGPGIAALYVLWALCLLVSILIHELGHALAFRQNGVESSIVLYHFGGLAIPRESWGSGTSVTRLSAKQDLWIALAGPLLQIASAAVLIGLFKLSDYRLDQAIDGWVYPWVPLGLGTIIAESEGKMIDSPGLFALLVFYAWPSIVWGLLNLVPVWPLDGGRITRSLILIRGGNTVQSLWISLIAAGLMAAYGLTNGQMFLGILFMSLAITNYQMIQQSGGWRY